MLANQTYLSAVSMGCVTSKLSTSSPPSSPSLWSGGEPYSSDRIRSGAPSPTRFRTAELEDLASLSRQRRSPQASGGHIRANDIGNPDEDQRVSGLVAMIGQVLEQSGTLRQRMTKLAGEGPFSIRIIPDENIAHTFGRAETRLRRREAVLSESTANAGAGTHFRPLNIALVELTNLSRAEEFVAVTTALSEGRISALRAAHSMEEVEYQTVRDMACYYREAHDVLQALGYGNPTLWYAHSRAGDCVYPDFETYYRTMVESGHRDAYYNNALRVRGS